MKARSYAKSRPLNNCCQQRTAPSTQLGPPETTSKYAGQRITLETDWDAKFWIYNCSYRRCCNSTGVYHSAVTSSTANHISCWDRAGLVRSRQQVEKLVEELPKLGRDKSTELGFFKFKPSAESATSRPIEQLLTTPDHVVTRRMAAGWTGKKSRITSLRSN